MTEVTIRPATAADRSWIRSVLVQRWGSVRIVSRGRVWQGDELDAFVALCNGEPAGLATYRDDGEQCELVSLDSLVQGTGIGTALVAVVAESTRQRGCTRLWLITTNDNLAALRFYQKRGFALVAVHRNALETSRRLKPGIPRTGLDGIPLRDELELELPIGEGAWPTRSVEGSFVSIPRGRGALESG